MVIDYHQQQYSSGTPFFLINAAKNPVSFWNAFLVRIWGCERTQVFLTLYRHSPCGTTHQPTVLPRGLVIIAPLSVCDAGRSLYKITQCRCFEFPAITNNLSIHFSSFGNNKQALPVYGKVAPKGVGILNLCTCFLSIKPNKLESSPSNQFTTVRDELCLGSAKRKSKGKECGRGTLCMRRK